MNENHQVIPWHDPIHPDELHRLEELAEVQLEQETKDHLATQAGSPQRSAGRFHVVKDRYIFGTISVPQMLRNEDRVVYHEVNVILTQSSFVTVRKAHPRHGSRFVSDILRQCCPDQTGRSAGEMFYRLMEDVAEAYEDLLDGVQDEIEELEAAVGLASDDRVHKRYSDLRRDLVEARRNIAPLVRALRAIEDERLDIHDQVFPTDTELLVRDVLENLERVGETIPLIGDLLSGVRDYHQSHVAERQNSIIQNLTVGAALLLVPTLIVGIYGQNFQQMPETRWRWGYGWSWAMIVVTTLIQLIVFWKVGWIGRKRSRPVKEKELGTIIEEAQGRRNDRSSSVP